MRFLKRLLKGVMIVALFVYLTMVGVLYFLQDSLLFPAPPSNNELLPVYANEVEIEISDGETLKVVELSVSQDAPYVMFFHGNGTLARYGLARGEAFMQAGYNVLLAEYQGYGGSSGKPSGKGLLSDALLQYDWLRAKSDATIYVNGHSLGTGPATYVAANREIGALFLEAPYSSTADVAAERYPLAPVKLLFKHDIVSKKYIDDVLEPIQIMHGNKDQVIPIKFGRKLFENAKPTDVFVEVEGAGHELTRHGSVEAAIEFFNSKRENN